MTILGIDPGYAIVGYGVIRYDGIHYVAVEFGAVRTPAGTPLPARLRTIYHGVRELLTLHRPDAMAVEELFFNTNTTTAIAVAEARGVILLAASEAGVPVAEYTPGEVKQAVVGYGRAKKPQMMELTRMLLGLPEVPKPDDTADALAIAICHANCAGSRLGALQNERR